MGGRRLVAGDRRGGRRSGPMSDDGTPRTFEGRLAFREALLVGLDDDAASEWWWVDPDFTDWPLDDPALVGALERWLARPARQLTLLACDFEALRRRWPRFVAWRRERAHRVFGRAVAIDRSQMPTLLLTGAPRGVQLLDRVRWRGVRIDDAADWRQARELVDALMQQSEASFAATTLGL